MQGAIVVQLQKYVTERYGDSSWQAILKEARVSSESKLFMITDFDDADFKLILLASCTVLRVKLSDFLENFGRFLGNYLFETYGSILNPSWKTLDIMEQSEKFIHQIFNGVTSRVKIPVYKVERKSPNALTVTYSSHRKLCFLGIGIIKAMADRFREHIKIEQPECMHHGDANCVLRLTKFH